MLFKKKWFFVGALLLLLGYFFGQGSPETQTERPPAPPTKISAPGEGAGLGLVFEATRAPSPVEPPEGLDRVCHQGDVWWIDANGKHIRKAKECGRFLCRAGVCDFPSTVGCGGVSDFGSCEGDIATKCFGGKIYRKDCSKRGKRCFVGSDGVGCIKITGNDCDESPRYRDCDGDVLVSCINGRYHRYNCASMGAQCGLLSEDHGVRCFKINQPGDLNTTLPNGEECGECGCNESDFREPSDEICDGLDNDKNGLIDDNAFCEPIDIIAFVVTDSKGESSYSHEELEIEIERLNEYMNAGGHGLGLTFRLEQIVDVKKEKWLEMSESDFTEARQLPLIKLKRESFYIPVFFTEIIIREDVPVLGVANYPNGECGGIRKHQEAQPIHTVVAVSKSRLLTTLAHEIGHFLGLCHTHEDNFNHVQHLIERENEIEICDPCIRDGDGLCDTPEDPGPSICRYSAASSCTYDCAEEYNPDISNIMSYYGFCRKQFSYEQMKEMRRQLSIQKKVFGCRASLECDCSPSPSDCPGGMSCVFMRNKSEWKCRMPGGVPEMGKCKRDLDCMPDHSCIHVKGADFGRCVKYCNVSTPGCRCMFLKKMGMSYCLEDLRRKQESND